MERYKIWDKTSDIYTLGTDNITKKNHFTAQEYINLKAPWAADENVKIVVGSGVVNGTVFMEFESMKDHYLRMGCDFSLCTTDDDYLRAIESFEDNPPGANEPTNEERIASALEAQVMMSLPDIVAEETSQNMAVPMSLNSNTELSTLNPKIELSKEAKRIQKNYERGLWSASLVDISVQKGSITSTERDIILNR